MEFKPLCLECKNYYYKDNCKKKENINIQIKIGNMKCGFFEEKERNSNVKNNTGK